VVSDPVCSARAALALHLEDGVIGSMAITSLSLWATKGGHIGCRPFQPVARRRATLVKEPPKRIASGARNEGPRIPMRGLQLPQERGLGYRREPSAFASRGS
jgi:hypothetical protein